MCFQYLPINTNSLEWCQIVQFSSVAQSCPTLCDPMNCSTPGLPVHHQLPEFTQTHVHWVGDAIQPSHPLLSPYPPSPNPSQHQGLFQCVNSSHEVAKVLEFQPQHQSFISDYCKVNTLIATTQEKRWIFAGLHLYDSSQSQTPLLQRDQKSKQDSLSFCMLITCCSFFFLPLYPVGYSVQSDTKPLTYVFFPWLSYIYDLSFSFGIKHYCWKFNENLLFFSSKFTWPSCLGAKKKGGCAILFLWGLEYFLVLVILGQRCASSICSFKSYFKTIFLNYSF